MKASVDRTAVWVGDHVTYTVDVICKPGIDILEDDLSKDHLKLEGLDVLSTETTQQDTSDGGRLHRFRYVLTTYHVDAPALKIAPMSVRYFTRRPGQRVQDATPAGDVAVPGVTLAFRSMLPDAQETYGLRDARTTQPRSRLLAHAQANRLGAGHRLDGAGALLDCRARAEPPPRRPALASARCANRSARRSRPRARSISARAEGRRDAYGQMNTIVREHLRDACGVPGLALTPAEIEPALGRTRSRVPADQVAALLLECDRARYAPADALPKRRCVPRRARPHRADSRPQVSDAVSRAGARMVAARGNRGRPVRAALGASPPVCRNDNRTLAERADLPRVARSDDCRWRSCSPRSPSSASL